MAYLSQVKAGGKQYIYLTEYVGCQLFSSKLEKHIFGFGSSDIAIFKMKFWYENFEKYFPEKLKHKGYDKQDLEAWIKTLETGMTKSGRKFNVEHQKTWGF